MEKERKGRNSFVDVRRKSLTFNNFILEMEEPSDKKSKETVKSMYQSLLKEKQDWKEILKEKKMTYKSTVKAQKLEAVAIKKEDVEKYFTPEDKELIDSRPNYADIINSVKKCMNSFELIDKYKSDMINYYRKACNELEINQKLLVDKMCAKGLCDVCNNSNCEVEAHKFSL